MGYAAGGSCHVTAQEAAGAFCRAFGGPSAAGFMTCSEPIVLNDSVSEAGAMMHFDMTVIGASENTSRVVYQGLNACEPLTMADGIELGWLIGGVWLGAACIRFLRRGAR